MLAMAAANDALLILIVLWTKSLVGGQNVTIQPISSEGDEGDPDSFAPFVFQVSGMDVGRQIVAIRRQGVVIADGTVKRTGVFDALGLDADNYVITRQVVLPESRQFSLRLTNPRRVDTAWFSFVVCGRNYTDAKCAEGDIILESDFAELTVRYVPGDLYPNCSAKGGVSIDGRMRVFLGETFILLCESELGQPPVNLSWEKGGQELASETSSNGEFRYSKAAFIPSLDDEGAVFACNLTRPLTNDLHRRCVLGLLDIVSEPTVVINYPDQNGFLLVGSTVVFTSVVTTVTSTINRTFWTVSEGLQNATDRYRIEGNRFTLRDIEEGDGGSNIRYVAIDDDDIQGVAMVTIQTINAGDLSTRVASTAGSTEVWTTEPPEDYSAVIIGSMFAALLVTIMVVMICMWYWREVRGKKSSPPVLGVDKVAKKSSHQKPSSDQGVKVISGSDHNQPTGQRIKTIHGEEDRLAKGGDSPIEPGMASRRDRYQFSNHQIDQYPPARERDGQTPHGGRNPGSPVRAGKHEALEQVGLNIEETHLARGGDSPIKQGTSSRHVKYPFSSHQSDHYVDDGTIDDRPCSQHEACGHEPVGNRRYQKTADKYMNNLYECNNDGYEDFDRYAIEPDTDDVSQERSYGRLTPSEMSDGQSQEHAPSQDNSWDNILRYALKEDEYVGVPSYV